jgi:SAM-dependent methyltransferase
LPFSNTIVMSLAHPLAQRLIEHLQHRPGSRVLDFASGSGRNSAALRDAGFLVTAVDDRRAALPSPLAARDGEFAAAVSTHGLLHGTPGSIAAALDAIAEHLENGGRLYAAFGSVRDSRFGQGECIGARTFAPLAGDERGVPHTFYDRHRLEALLSPGFILESLEEVGADATAGAWAHADRPLQGAVHWFAVAQKR